MVVSITEHLDTVSAPIFESRLLGLVDQGERQLVVDCGALDYVNSAGVKVFLLAAKRLEPLGGKLILCALSSSVGMLIAARAVQGAGAAFILSLALALLNPRARRHTRL